MLQRTEIKFTKRSGGYHNSAQEDIHIPESHIKCSESWALNIKSFKTGEELLKLFIFPLFYWGSLETKAKD